MAIEKELLEAIELMKDGKEEGFNLLYSYTYRFVYSRARSIMNNEQDALDLTQETYTQAYKGIHSLKDTNTIYAWLGAIVYNQGMQIYKKNKHETLVDEESEYILETIENEDKDMLPEESAEAKALSDILVEILDELPEFQRAAIMAFYYDNMKIEEIAEVFECSPNTIKSRLNYAKKFLKTKIEEHEKANQYRLHTLSPTIIIVSCENLLAKESYILSATAAQTLYNTICGVLGLAPTAILTVEAGASVLTNTIAESTTAAATETSSAVATTATKKTGLSIGVKIAIGLATTAVISVVAIINRDKTPQPPVDTQQESFIDNYKPPVQPADRPLDWANTSYSENGLITSQTINWPDNTTLLSHLYGLYGISNNKHYTNNGGIRIEVYNVYEATDTDPPMINLRMEERQAEDAMSIAEIDIKNVPVEDLTASFETKDTLGRKWSVTLKFTEEGHLIFNGYWKKDNITKKIPEQYMYQIWEQSDF